MKRLLILSASSGRGHVAAARAVAATIEAARTPVEVLHVDLFDHVALPVRLLGREGYDLCVERFPWLWRLAYERTYRKLPAEWPAAVTRALSRRFLSLVRDFRPDRILSTYWSAGPMLPAIREALGHAVPLAVVITDADLHAAWWHPGVDRYYVSDPTIRDGLVGHGFPAERVVVSGIPAHPRFAPTPRTRARTALGLDPGRRLLLVVAGPRAMRPLALRLPELRRTRPDLGVAVLVGRDVVLRRELARAVAEDAGLVVRGMVPDMERWIGAADILAAKGGGLITAEATAVGTPVLIHRPIPGQEEANARRLEGEGAALVVKGFDHLREVVTDLFDPASDGALAGMTAAAVRVGRPDAAAVIARSEADLLAL